MRLTMEQIKKSSFDKCPVCGSRMESGHFLLDCINECFGVSHQGATLFRTVFVFKEKFQINTNEDIITLDIINDRISYWKKNDRYLMEIMSCD